MDNVIKLLSESDLKKLIDLATQLKTISDEEEELVLNAKELISQGNELDRNKSELIDKSKHVINDEDGRLMVKIDNSIESEEFIDIVKKSGSFKIEEETINEKADDINKELERLIKNRNKLINDINNVFESASQKNIGIKVDGIGFVYVLDKNLPNEVEKMSSDLCEIINCGISLIKEIKETFNKNKTKFTEETIETGFNKLKKYVSEYDANKNETYSNQLELLNKTIEGKIESQLEVVEPKTVEIKEEQNIVTPTENIISQPEPVIDVNVSPVVEPVTPVVELPKEEIKVEEKPIIDVNEPLTNETVVSQPEPVVVKDPVTLEVISETKPESENIVPLSDVINTNEISETTKTEEKTLYMIVGDKVTPNQIARATKDKLYNKIILIFEGSYIKPSIKSVKALNEVDVNNGFNMESFASNVAA